tara:strand:- start:2137 stop:2520 length:384 start_codon:yes stop_codon:yes gene_type:complete
MPPAPRGEMSLSDIRNLVRQHNQMTTISPSQTRPKLLAAIAAAGYKVDHVGRKLVKRPRLAPTTTTISVTKGGAVKPQKRTVRKAFAASSSGEKPVLVKKKKSPPIPANKKGKKLKPDRSALISGSY